LPQRRFPAASVSVKAPAGTDDARPGGPRPAWLLCSRRPIGSQIPRRTGLRRWWQ